MKTIINTLMITAAVACFALPAQAASLTTETTVIETGKAQDPAALEAAKLRMTRDLQAALANRGYDVAVTGSFDAKTDKAVRAYQASNNMAVTGEASAELLADLGVDTSIRNTHLIQERQVMKYDLADKGSENANVYDDPNADRTGAPVFKQRYQRLTTRIAPEVTTTQTTTVYTSPVLNR